MSKENIDNSVNEQLQGQPNQVIISQNGFSDDESAGSIDNFSAEDEDFDDFFDSSANSSVHESDFDAFEDSDLSESQNQQSETIKIQQKLASMTEKCLRAEVAILEQRQKYEQTQALVKDKAKEERNDLQRALHGL